MHKATGSPWEYILQTTARRRSAMWAGAKAYHDRQADRIRQKAEVL